MQWISKTNKFLAAISGLANQVEVAEGISIAMEETNTCLEDETPDTKLGEPLEDLSEDGILEDQPDDASITLGDEDLSCSPSVRHNAQEKKDRVLSGSAEITVAKPSQRIKSYISLFAGNRLPTRGSNLEHFSFSLVFPMLGGSSPDAFSLFVVSHMRLEF